MDNYRDQVHELESRWQQYWAEADIYRTPNPGDADFDAGKPKHVILDFFPYPSGVGLHIGHPLGYIATDVISRFKRMLGFNVLYGMGFDSFGLPAEQYAVQTGQHPRITTENNIANMLSQLKLIGLGHDPHRRFSTHEPAYYRWTQWIFLQLYQSFYDPTASWIGPDGKENVGRARPISELPALLRSGTWRLDEAGVPVPAEQPAARPVALSEVEIARAVERARLAFLAEVPVNWCPQLGTVLANEEVTSDGRSERGNFPVFKRPLEQWVLRITAYAERLGDDLSDLDWPAGIVEMQRNWIGRSQGAQVRFEIAASAGSRALPPIEVFTTRPDTLFGATYMVLAPEHPLVEQVTTPAQRNAVQTYRQAARLAAKAQREVVPEKTGVFTGGFAVNPANGEQIPIWIADYVLMDYGTGAIMAVPAHDERDFAFAKAFGLPIRPVVAPDDAWLKAQAGAPPAGVEHDVAALRDAYVADPGRCAEAFTGTGLAIKSANAEVSLDGLSTPLAKSRMIDWLVSRGLGVGRVQYKLRDWLFSRQRYWGEPFPVVYDAESRQVHALADSELPVVLPELTNFSPSSSDDPDSAPETPLSRAREWMEVSGIVLADGRVRTVSAEPGTQVEVEGRAYPVRKFRRDSNTMPNWAGSCWYYLRYADAANDRAFVGPDAEHYWMAGRDAAGRPNAGGVDLYVGGAEHAVLHLLYARFWHKVLYDLGHVSTREPFQKLFNQGMITADAYSDARGFYVDIHEVDVRQEGGRDVAWHTTTGERLKIETGKMGKRYKNGIPPEEVCADYSVDVFRLYEMYMGPLDATKPWNTRDIIGMQRFCQAVWQLLHPLAEPAARQSTAPPDPEVDRLVHKTIKKVTEEIGSLRLNTAIASLIELTNALKKQPTVHPEHARSVTLMLAPFTPHLSEELFSGIFPEEHARVRSVVWAEWPAFDPEKCVDARIEVPVTVNGKKRGKIVVDADADDATITQAARAEEGVRAFLGDRVPFKEIVARNGKSILVNLVVK